MSVEKQREQRNKLKNSEISMSSMTSIVSDSNVFDITIIDIEEQVKESVEQMKKDQHFAEIFEIFQGEVCSQVLEEDQQVIFDEYLQLAKMKDLTEYQQNSSKSQIMTMKLVGINKTDEKKMMQQIREILNKCVTVKDIQSQFSQLQKKDLFPPDDLQHEFVSQLIYKAALEKKFWQLYAGILEKESSHDLVVCYLDKYFELSYLEDADPDLQKQCQQQMCFLIGYLSSKNSKYLQFAQKKLDMLIQCRLISNAIDMAQYMNEKEKITQLYNDLNNEERTLFIEFKFDQYCSSKNVQNEPEPDISIESQTPFLIPINFCLFDIDEIIAEIKEIGLLETSQQLFKCQLTSKAAQSTQFLQFMKQLTFQLLMCNQRHLLKEELTQLMSQLNIKEQQKIYLQLVVYLLQNNQNLLTILPQFYEDLVKFISQLIFQSKCSLLAVLQEVNKFPLDLKKQFTNSIFITLVYFANKSTLYDLQEEMKPEFRFQMTQLVQQKDYQAIFNLNQNQQYLSFAKNAKFGYFDQPDCSIKNIPNHFEANYIQMFQVIVQKEQQVIQQLLQMFQKQDQNQFQFFSQFFGDMNLKPILNAFIKFIQCYKSEEDGLKNEMYRLKLQIMNKQRGQFCIKMAYDLLKEMRASKESYDFFGLLKEADK